MDESKEILIEKFFNNVLNAEEQRQFNKLLLEDAAFKEEVKLQKQVIRGIEHYGEDLLRAEILAVQRGAKNNLHDYKPPKGGNFLWKLLGWVVFVGAIWLAANFILFGNEGGPIWPQKHEHHESQKSEIEQMEARKQFKETLPGLIKRDTIIRMETIYHTFKTRHITRRDTVVVYDESGFKRPKGKGVSVK
jgi:hypothetical protein